VNVVDAILTCLVGCVLLLLWGSLWLIFGWIGHIVIKGLTFGRVRLGWQRDSESCVTQLFGVFFVLAIAGLVAWVIHK